MEPVRREPLGVRRPCVSHVAMPCFRRCQRTPRGMPLPLRWRGSGRISVIGPRFATQGWLERRQHAWRVADVAARGLRAEFGAEQVWVFGSLARDGVFDEHADIDLAVSGVDESAWFDATRMLLGLDGAFLIDLARLEGAPDALRRNILSEGILL
jgi:predicted nucleotidyltransferase